MITNITPVERVARLREHEAALVALRDEPGGSDFERALMDDAIASVRTAIERIERALRTHAERRLS